jgi:FixJ family two-component response regulator
MQGFVHVVDDDASFRKAIERRLKHAGYDVATYASAEHLLDCLPSASIPSCILLDVQIPELSGPELQERLSELGSTLPIIFLTGYPDVRTTVRTIKAGAEDFLIKPVPSNKLLQAVERAIARQNAAYLVKSARAVVLARIGTLTPRERQVFELVILGKQNKQIAFALGCTERTIKAHRHSVMEKMQVQSLAELVSLAERVGVHELAAGQTSLGISDRQVPQCEDRSPPPR